MRVERRKVMCSVATLSATMMLLMGSPAQAAGAGIGANAFSPKLSGGFPCVGNAASAGQLATFTAWATGSGLPDLSKCAGTFYDGGQNSGSFSATNGSDIVVGTGSIAGSYKYAEPCQDNPGGGKGSGPTGEAYGTITYSLTTATGVINGAPFSGTATVEQNFFWSRVGVNAIIGLGTTKVTAGSASFKIGSGTIGNALTDKSQTGIATAVFTLTPDNLLNGCSRGTVPAVGDIEIFFGSVNVSQ